MKKLLFCLMPLLLPAGCKDAAEPIPAYLKVEPFTVNETGGAGWQKITEAWVYVDNDLLGGYTLPAAIPVLAEGERTITIFPGVKENGLKLTPRVYPFMVRFEQKINLMPGQTVSIQPSTKYASTAIFPWSVERASFNNASIGLEDRDADSLSTFVFTTDSAFEGRSLLLAVDTAHAVNEVATELVAGLPVTNAQPVWLEMNYRNDIPFEFWMLGTRDNSNELSVPVYQFVTSAGWNKIYLNLTSSLITLKQDKYRLFFRIYLPRDEKGNFIKSQGKVLLDNLRLIHY